MSDIVQPILLQIILILLNAFFAATEIAVISLNEKKMKARADDGDKKAAKLFEMIKEPTKFLSTIQIGITLAGFLGSAFAADNFAESLSNFVVEKFNISVLSPETVNTIAVVVITLVLSFFTLVLGELVPKRLAMRHKEKFAEMVCGIISVLTAILKPIIWLLTVSTNGVLRLCGVNPQEKEETVSEEDIVLMLDAGVDEGSIKQDGMEYIKNVFKLDDSIAEDVMTPRRSVVFIPQDSTAEQIVEVIETEGYSRIPVYSETTDNIIGILYARDFLLKHNQPNFKLEDVMFQPTFVPTTIHLDVLFKNMQKEHNHIVVVINEYGETAGIVTMEDILEEIVGEIWDEHDVAVEEFLKLDETHYRVLCSASIEDFFELFQLEWSEEIEATTINGWMTEQLGNIPKKGDFFEYENLLIKVTKTDDFVAKEIKVTVVPKELQTENGF